MEVKTFKDLKVWQESIQLVKVIYKLTKKFPEEEKFCLSNQMRRASISIPSNIAEGANKRSSKDYVRFVDISLGSVAELETQLIISLELEYINKIMFDEVNKKIDEIGKMLRGLSISLNKNTSTSN